jgi:hypothetical protein
MLMNTVGRVVIAVILILAVCVIVYLGAYVVGGGG